MKRWIQQVLVFALFTVLVFSACTQQPAPTGSNGANATPREVTVYVSTDRVFSEPILRAYEQQSGVRVNAVYDTEETKSTGVVNRLIAEGRSPQADVFWSGDPVRQFLLVKRGLGEPYVSPEAKGLPEGLRAEDGTWAGVAARARVLLVPEDAELLDPRHRLDGRLARAGRVHDFQDDRGH